MLEYSGYKTNFETLNLESQEVVPPNHHHITGAKTMIDSIIYKQRSRRRTRPSKWGARKAVVAVLTATSACSGFEVTGFPSGLRHNIITSKGSCHAFIPTMSTKQLYTRHPKFISGSGQGMMKDQNDFEPSVVGHTTADYPHNLTDNNPGTFQKK